MVATQKQLLGVRTQTCTDLVQLELSTGSAKSLVQQRQKDMARSWCNKDKGHMARSKVLLRENLWVKQHDASCPKAALDILGRGGRQPRFRGDFRHAVDRDSLSWMRPYL